MAFNLGSGCRINSQQILADKNLNENEKLFFVFQQYKEEIQGTQLYYALLNWQDKHKDEFRKKGLL